MWPVTHAISAAILNLHRPYFTQALGEGFWANHKYATSVVAVYQAALSLLWCLETYYRQQPEYSVRSQMLWSNGLSSAVSSDAVGHSLLGPWANHKAGRTITVGDSSSPVGDGIQRPA